jgi:hypothetical protein
MVVVFLVLGSACGSENEERTFDDVLGAELSTRELLVLQQASESLKEDTIAVCMRRQGFEYISWVDPVFRAPDAQIVDLTEREVVEMEGFGLTLSPELTLGLEVPEPEHNPNVALFESLGPAEQKAWDVAYWGFDPTASGEDVVVVESNSGLTDNEGCLGEGLRTGLPENPASAEQLDSYFELVAQIDDDVADDPRVVLAYDEVVDCLNEKGFEATSVEGFSSETAEFLAGELGVDLEDLDPFILEQMVQNSSLSSDALDEAKRYESATALALFDCNQDVAAIEEEVRHGLERELVEQHFELLVAVDPHLRRAAIPENE